MKKIAHNNINEKGVKSLRGKHKRKALELVLEIKFLK
jgi:hypothetical protein